MGRAATTPLVVGVALAVHLLLLVPLLSHHDGDPSALVYFTPDSPAFDAATEVRGTEPAVPRLNGHDGERFWVLANDPLLLDDDTPDLLDRPTYRAQRILYPLLVAPSALVGPDAVYWAMLAVNLVAVGVGTALTVRLGRELGVGAWSGLLYALNPAVVFSVGRDLSDAIAIAAVVGALLAVRLGRWPAAVAAGTVAVLAKEPSLLALAGVALLVDQGSSPLPGATLRRRGALVAVPAAVAGAWGLYVRWRFEGVGGGSQEFDPVPFSGYVETVDIGWIPYGLYTDAAAALFVVVVAVVVALRWWRRRTPEMAASLPFVLLVPFLSHQVVFRQVNSLRALGPVLTLVALDWLAQRQVTDSEPSSPPRRPSEHA